MDLIKFSIQRPVATIAIFLGLSLLGINSYRKMGLELMPKVDIPFITITTIYPGANPQELEFDVAKKIEDAVASIEGLKHVMSSCQENVVMTFLEFHLGTDVDIATTNVREKLDLIRDQLPSLAEDPKILKFDINAKPIVTLALGGNLPLEELYLLADEKIRDRLASVPGVADTEIIGGEKLQLQILLDPKKLSSYGLTPLDIYQKIQSDLGSFPAGRLTQSDREIPVSYNADPQHPYDLLRFPIKTDQNGTIYLKDLATVKYGTPEFRKLSRLNGKPALTIRVIKKAEANTVEVTRLIRKRVEEIRREIPAETQLVWINDDATFIENTIFDTWLNVAEGILITAIIIFCFLYEFRSLFIITITMPLTIIVGFFFMELCGFTINISTLIAIGMSVGILVTNTIVVLEAIFYKLEKGSSPKEAAWLGPREIMIAVMASASTNLVVLLPLAMMKSMVGMFMKPLALTMLIMTLVSLFISFTLTPMLASRILSPQTLQRRGLLRWLYQKWEQGFSRIVGGYHQLLIYQSSRPFLAGITIFICILSWGIVVFLLPYIGNDFVKEADRGEITIKVEFPITYSLARTLNAVQTIEERLSSIPHVQNILSMVGKVEGVIGQSSEGTYLAQILLTLPPKTERKESAEVLIYQVRQILSHFPDAEINVSKPAMVGGQAYPIQLEISGEDFAILHPLTQQVSEAMGKIPGIVDVSHSVKPQKKSIQYLPKREIVTHWKLSNRLLGILLRTTLEGMEVGTFKTSRRNYDIVVKMERSEGEGESFLSQLMIADYQNRTVPLSTLLKKTYQDNPVILTRKNKERITVIYANLTEDLALGNAVQQISQNILEKIVFPPGYRYQFSGIYEILTEAQEAFIEAGIIATILLFITLAALLESWRNTFYILITLPPTIVGVLIALFLTKVSSDIFVMMSCVMMIGIVVNNGILIMDRVGSGLQEGLSHSQAMVLACKERFRPIVMITIAAIIGMVPLAIARGLGSELRNGVGIASIGGILVSAIYTFILLPILYLLIHHRQKKPSSTYPLESNPSKTESK